MVASRRTTAALPSYGEFAMDSHPSEQELIASFLRPRVASGDKKSSCSKFIIHEADVYASHPADLTREHASALASNGEEAWYFFTAMRSKGGGRKVRTVDTGEGCWHSEAGAKPVIDARAHRGGGHLGHRQSFSFVTKVDGRRVRSGWLMVELGLDDGGQDKLTLCKVYFSPRALKNKKSETSTPSGRKMKATDINDDSDDAASSPARQGRRCRARTEAAGSWQSETEDESETIGKTEGEKPSAAGGEADESVDDEPAVSFSAWLQNDAETSKNISWCAGKDGETKESFSWWVGNDGEETRKILEDIRKEELEWEYPARAAVEFLPVPETRLYDFEVDNSPPVAGSAVARDKDAPVCMWLTLDEMYDHPEARKLLSPTPCLEEMRRPVEKNQ